MLQALTGTLDRQGIRSLSIEHDRETRRSTQAGFWAVLDSPDVHEVVRALAAGERLVAWHLLTERSVSVGTILPRP